MFGPERISRQTYGNNPKRSDVFKFNRYDNSYANIFGRGDQEEDVEDVYGILGQQNDQSEQTNQQSNACKGSKNCGGRNDCYACCVTSRCFAEKGNRVRNCFQKNKTEKVQSKTARQVCDWENLLAINKHV